MSRHDTHALPTFRQLGKATGVALVAAAAILVSAVLPAEFGIDPTGVGGWLGLTAMRPATADAAIDIASAGNRPAELPGETLESAPATAAAGEAVLRSDEMSLVLQPSEGAEIKATMRQGEQFVFQWASAGGPVNFDMHGERPGATDEFTSYRKGSQQSGDRGVFVAPFDGTHGWFWRNRGNGPVMVKVRVSGFHERLARMK